MAYRWYAVVGPEGQVLRAIDGDDARVVKGDTDGLLRLSDTGEIVETRWVLEGEAALRDGQPTHQEFGVRLVGVAEKMSKSRGNVVNPDAIVEEFGADSLRLYEMFMGPLEQSKPWQTSAIQGVRRFLDRVHGLAMRDLSSESMSDETARLVHRTIKKVGEDIEALHLNTAISSMMILSNHLVSIKSPPREAVERLVLCLSPFAPHIAEEIWSSLGHSASVAQLSWPEYDPSLCEDALVEMAVQVNGKVRGRVTIAKDAETKAVETAALADAGVQRFIGERSVKKTIYVPGKILNIIIE